MNTTDSNSLPAADTSLRKVKKKSPLRTAIILLICLGVGGGVVTLLVFAVRAAREAARCQHCRNNLMQLGIGLLCFDDAEGSLPPAYLCDEKDKPIHSWQSIAMSFLGCYSWQNHYSMKEPWDGPNNIKLQSRPYRVFQCPSVEVGNRSRLTVDYVAVVGPDTMWPGRERVALPAEGEGNQNSILLIEMPDSDYGALEPRSPTVGEFMAKIKSPTGKGIRCIHPQGLAYVTVGGEVRWFPPETDPETIRRLLKRDPTCKVIPAEEKMKIIENWGGDEYRP